MSGTKHASLYYISLFNTGLLFVLCLFQLKSRLILALYFNCNETHKNKGQERVVG